MSYMRYSYRVILNIIKNKISMIMNESRMDMIDRLYDNIYRGINDK